MIYHAPRPDDPVDQGDVIDGCAIVRVTGFPPDQPDAATVALDVQRVVVLSQTCDLANDKIENAVVATVFDAATLVDRQILKAADIKGPLRGGRVWGWYFLPANASLGLGEMIVDLRRLHTIRIELLHALAKAGRRYARLRTPYREHLSKHFADTFSRIGLPEPYETL